jgi:hypothetical protein
VRGFYNGRDSVNEGALFDIFGFRDRDGLSERVRAFTAILTEKGWCWSKRTQ